eukprot:jgi/Mesvir1/14685/Mv05348-RA.2
MLANAMVCVQLPLFLTDLFGDAIALILSVAFLFLFGQMLPQALCARRALPFASSLCWLVWPLVLLLLPAAWLPSRILEAVVGKEPRVFYKRRELDALVQAHADAAADGSKLPATASSSGRQLAVSSAVAIATAGEAGQQGLNGAMVTAGGSSHDGRSGGGGRTGGGGRKLVPAAVTDVAGSSSSQKFVRAGSSGQKVIPEDGDGDDASTSVSLLGHSYVSEMAVDMDEDGEDHAEGGGFREGEMEGQGQGRVRLTRRGKLSRKWSFIRRFLSFRAAYEGTLAWTPDLLALALPGGSAVVVPRDLSQMSADGQGPGGPGGAAGGTGEAILTQVEASIIRGVLDMHNKHVRDVYTPLASVFALPINGHITPECVRLVRDSGVSRVPVYLGRPDNFVGVILAKSFIGLNGAEQRPIASMSIRQVPFVSAGLLLQDALSVFRVGRSHLAVVLDERDRVSVMGVVTLEDVLEALLGFEIVDETDVPEGEDPGDTLDQHTLDQHSINQHGLNQHSHDQHSLNEPSCTEPSLNEHTLTGSPFGDGGSKVVGGGPAGSGYGVAGSGYNLGGGGSTPGGGVTAASMSPTSSGRPRRSSLTAVVTHTASPTASPHRRSQPSSPFSAAGSASPSFGAPPQLDLCAPPHVPSSGHARRAVFASDVTSDVTACAPPSKIALAARAAAAHHAATASAGLGVGVGPDASTGGSAGAVLGACTLGAVSTGASSGGALADASYSSVSSPSSSKRRSFSDIERTDVGWADASRNRLEEPRNWGAPAPTTVLSPGMLRSSSLGPSQGLPGSPLAGEAAAEAAAVVTPVVAAVSPTAVSSVRDAPAGSMSGSEGAAGGVGVLSSPAPSSSGDGGIDGVSQGNKRLKAAAGKGASGKGGVAPSRAGKDAV